MCFKFECGDFGSPKLKTLLIFTSWWRMKSCTTYAKIILLHHNKEVRKLSSAPSQLDTRFILKLVFFLNCGEMRWCWTVETIIQFLPPNRIYFLAIKSTSWFPKHNCWHQKRHSYHQTARFWHQTRLIKTRTWFLAPNVPYFLIPKILFPVCTT